MELSVRSRKALQRLGIKMVSDLLDVTEQELRETKNFGETSLNEIKGRLAEYGGLMIGQHVPNKQLPQLARVKLRNLHIKTLRQIAQLTHCSLHLIVGNEIDEVIKVLKTRGLSLADGEPIDDKDRISPHSTFWQVSHMLTTRLRNVLLQAGWSPEMTLNEMSNWTEGELQSIKGLAETGVAELRALLDNAGLEFASRPHPVVAGAEDVQQALLDAGKQTRLLKQPIRILGLSIRAENCLDVANILTLGDLVKKTEAQLLRLRSFGRTSLYEIQRKLAERGLCLSGEPDQSVPQLFDATYEKDDILTRKVQAYVGDTRKSIQVEIELRGGVLIMTPYGQDPITLDYDGELRLKIADGVTINVDAAKRLSGPNLFDWTRRR